MQRRESIRSHALLRQRGQFGGQLLGGFARLAFGHNTIGQPDRQRFIGLDRAAGEDHVHRPALPDQPRQPHRATVDQRHPPAAAEHPEHGILLGDPQIAPQRQLQTPRDRVAADRGDHRFGQHHPASAPSGRDPSGAPRWPPACRTPSNRLRRRRFRDRPTAPPPTRSRRGRIPRTPRTAPWPSGR